MTAAQYLEYARTGKIAGQAPATKAAPSHTFGVMNKLETKYSFYLEALKGAGEIEWWEFEMFTLRLAPRTTITIDFIMRMKNGAMNLKDTKGGFVREDARIKLKWAAKTLRGKFGVAIVTENPAKNGWCEEWL